MGGNEDDDQSISSISSGSSSSSDPPPRRARQSTPVKTYSYQMNLSYVSSEDSGCTSSSTLDADESQEALEGILKKSVSWARDDTLVEVREINTPPVEQQTYSCWRFWFICCCCCAQTNHAAEQDVQQES